MFVAMYVVCEVKLVKTSLGFVFVYVLVGVIRSAGPFIFISWFFVMVLIFIFFFSRNGWNAESLHMSFGMYIM